VVALLTGRASRGAAGVIAVDVRHVPATDLHQRVRRALDRAERVLQTSRDLVARERALQEALAATLAETRRARAARASGRPRS
jgi:hypothetical protein